MALLNSNIIKYEMTRTPCPFSFKQNIQRHFSYVRIALCTKPINFGLFDMECDCFFSLFLLQTSFTVYSEPLKEFFS